MSNVKQLALQLKDKDAPSNAPRSYYMLHIATFLKHTMITHEKVCKYRYHKNCTVTSSHTITTLLRITFCFVTKPLLHAGTAFRHGVHLPTCSRTKTDRQLSIWPHKEIERGTEQAYSSQNSCNFIMGQWLRRAALPAETFHIKK